MQHWKWQSSSFLSLPPFPALMFWTTTFISDTRRNIVQWPCRENELAPDHRNSRYNHTYTQKQQLIRKLDMSGSSHTSTGVERRQRLCSIGHSWVNSNSVCTIHCILVAYYASLHLGATFETPFKFLSTTVANECPTTSGTFHGFDCNIHVLTGSPAWTPSCPQNSKCTCMQFRKK